MAKKVVSTLPVRQNDATKKSFDKSEAKLSYLFNSASSDFSTAEKIDLWNSFVPMSPSMAAKILRRDLPDDISLELKLDELGEGAIEYYIPGVLSDKGEFDLEEQSLDAGIIRVQDGYKGQGYGRTMFRNQVEFFYACGVRKFEIVAALDNGGYTWARVGFLPDDVGDEGFKSSVIDPARQALEVLAPLLTKAEKQKIEKALAFKKPEDLWDIADSEIDLGTRLKVAFNKSASCEDDKFSRAATDIKRHFNSDVIDYMQDNAMSGKPVKLGRLLLTGTDWEGHLDMDNVKQMRRLSDYSGGFKYLSFK